MGPQWRLPACNQPNAADQGISNSFGWLSAGTVRKRESPRNLIFVVKILIQSII
jgi:hypothetical protein